MDWADRPRIESLFPFFTYSTLYEGRYVTPALGPKILEIQRNDTANGVSLSLAKELNLSPLVGKRNQIINSVYDIEGRLWWTTGGFRGAGFGSANTTAVIGYVERDGSIRHLVVPDTNVENGVSISGTTVHVNTGPAGANDHPNAVGHLYSLASGPDGIQILFNETYDAGSGVKPGGISCGSGSSPNPMNFFKQAKNSDASAPSERQGYDKLESSSNHVCAVPIFRPNASATENTLITHFNGTIYSAIGTASYSAPPPINLFNSSTTLNSPDHLVTTANPGFVRVDFDPRDNTCHVCWQVDLPGTGIPTLSTATGLLYQYHQDIELTKKGKYVWYVSAVDWESGEIVWSVRTVMGPLYNNNYQSTTLGPDGAVYTWVQGGIVKCFDQTDERCGRGGES